MARRTRPVRKLLDEPLKLLGLLTLRSAAWAVVVYCLNYFVLELVFGVWSAMFGPLAALLAPLGVALLVACVLGLVESYEDQHAFGAAVRFHWDGQSRIVYSAGCPDGVTPIAPPLGEIVAVAAKRLFRFGRRPAYAFNPRPLPKWMYVGLWRRKEIR